MTLALLVALCAVWAFAPRPDRFRSFDPQAVGHAEAQMWRAYYERRPLDLSAGLLLNASWDFGFSPFDSARLGLEAGQAARTFQRSHSRAEAEAALPALRRYFVVLCAATHSSFGKGSGLGLSMVYGFAQQSGGDLKIISALGRGTEIAILLIAG